MSFNTALEGKITAAVKGKRNIAVKKMFGGLCYLLKGNMCFGVYKDYLIVRMAPETAAKKLKQKNTRVFDITGRPMKGWVMVGEASWQSAASLKKWLEEGLAFAGALPPK